MNSEEIIEMAKQAGLLQSVNGMVHTHTSKELRAFAKLVEDKVKAECGQAATTLDEMRRRYDEHFTKALGKKD